MATPGHRRAGISGLHGAAGIVGVKSLAGVEEKLGPGERTQHQRELGAEQRVSRGAAVGRAGAGIAAVVDLEIIDIEAGADAGQQAQRQRLPVHPTASLPRPVAVARHDGDGDPALPENLLTDTVSHRPSYCSFRAMSDLPRPPRNAFATRVIHAGQQPDPTTGAIMPPIYATSTYVQDSPGVHRGYEYSRTRNPTRFAYERCVADLESGSRGYAFASGLAATATVLDLLAPGDHVIAGNDLYGGSYRLFERVRARSAGLRFSFVDVRDPAQVEAAIRPETRLIWIETPSNPLLRLTDLAAIAAIGRRHQLLTAADNTFASPCLQRPLELGFDLVMHSATKYLNGHSDMVGGLLVVGDNAELAERLAFLQNAVGGIAGPFDAFLALRGVKTLALRMARHCENAETLAGWLERHPKVARVHYPGLASHPQRGLARRQMPKAAAA